jgi:hypothetical protein
MTLSVSTHLRNTWKREKKNINGAILCIEKFIALSSANNEFCGPNNINDAELEIHCTIINQYI